MGSGSTLCNQVPSHLIQKVTQLSWEVGHQCILIYRFTGNRTTAHVRECSAIFTILLGTEALCADTVSHNGIRTRRSDKPGRFFQTHKLEDPQRAIRQLQQIPNSQFIRRSTQLVKQCVGARRLHLSNQFVVLLANRGGSGRVRCPAKLRGNLLAEAVDLEADHLDSS